MGIGERLRLLLDERGRNINELAQTIHVSPQTLYSILKRNNTKVDLEILQKVADELSVTLDYFCGLSSPLELSDITLRRYSELSEEAKKMAAEYIRRLWEQDGMRTRAVARGGALGEREFSEEKAEEIQKLLDNEFPELSSKIEPKNF